MLASATAVALVCASPLDATVFADTPTGRSLARLRSDRRLRERLVPTAAADGSALRLAWRELAAQCLSGRSAGVVWLRDDVLVDDYHLVERLAEAWTVQDMVVARDAEGRPLFWALSRRGLSRWQPGDKPVWPALTGDFPRQELDALRSRGIEERDWPLSLSLAIAPHAPSDVGTKLRDLLCQPVGSRRFAPPVPLLVVTATREPAERFATHTVLGRSIDRLRATGLQVDLYCAFHNRGALATAYNAALKPQYQQHIALFVHDDVWLDDRYLVHRLHDGLSAFDLLGVAGSRNRSRRQPAWCFPARVGEWEAPEHLLGAVAHDTESQADKVSAYGAPRGAARLMDGVLLAARVRTLLACGLRFDERFPFHFYDLDFCRSAEQRGLRLGVWPLALTHLSGGAGYRSPDWFACYGRYIGKYGS